MKRGRIETEQAYAAAIRQTLAEVNRDAKQRRQPFGVDEFYVFDLPPYDFGNGQPEPSRLGTFKELKAELRALEQQSR